MGINPVRKSANKVLLDAEFLSINHGKAKELAEKLIVLDGASDTYQLLNKLNTDDLNKKLIFLLIITRTGFCFWNAEKTRWHYTLSDGSKDKGQFAFIQAWLDYFNGDISRLDLAKLANLSLTEFKNIFQGGEGLYFIEERHKYVQFIAEYFLENWNGKIDKFVLDAGHSAEKLLEKLIMALPIFDDFVEYKGERVKFWKLAQLFIYELINEFPDHEIGKFLDINYLTALADYKVPQLLEANGVLEYADELNKKIVGKRLIEAGSQEEVEVRSATIVAVDLLYKAYQDKGGNLKMPKFENLLFMTAKGTKFDKPYHLAKSLYY
jgi:hypothetical protein